MRRIITIPLIFVVGGLVLWEVLSWGTRTWVNYGLMKEPLPSITTFLPTSMILPVIATLLIVLLIATTVMALLRSRKIFGIVPIPELMRHVVVVGPTGSGKTTITKMIIGKVTKVLKSRSPSIIILDWKGEYRQFIPSATVVRKIPNIWDVPGDSPREKALVMVELLREMSKDVVEITPASSLLLLKVLEEEYRKGVPTTKRIIDILERSAAIAQREGKFAESNMYMALIRRLYIVLVDEERQAVNEAGDPRVVVYDLGSLTSVYLKVLYCNYVISKLYREAMKFRNSELGSELRTLLIAEEGQNYIYRRANEPPSMAERLVYEMRGFGVGVVLVCPDPELLPPSILKDVGTVVSTSPDVVPKFALERYLFRASLGEAEDTLKKLKSARAIVYYKGNLHFFRRLPKPLKIVRPKGDRMGVTDPGGRSLRAWPILPHRSPGILAPKVIEVKEEVEERPKVIEIREVAAVEEKPKVVEVVEELKLEEEELEEPEAIEAEVEKSSKPIEVKKEKVSEEEKEVMVEEEVPIAVELEPAPEGPPIPSTLPYRGSLCPAGRTATSGRSL